MYKAPKQSDTLYKSCRLCLCDTPKIKQTGSTHYMKSVHIWSFSSLEKPEELGKLQIRTLFTQ